MSEITENDLAKFYDETYYKSEALHSIRPLSHYRGMLDFLKPIRRDAKCLDIGCGGGLFLKACVDAGLAAYGVDISQKAVNISKKIVPDALVVCGSGENLQFSDSFFDYIFFGGTLEHFLNVGRGLDEAVRVANDSAIFMIVVPNKNYWLWRIRGEYGTHQKEIKELLLDRDGWTDLFKEHGLVPVRVYQDPWPWQSVPIFKKKNPWKIIRRMIYRFIWLFIPVRCTYQFVFICKKSD